MDAILSIKPVFVDRIFVDRIFVDRIFVDRIFVDRIFVDGTKGYEFRRVIFRRPVDRIIVYASRPVMKIVGQLQVGEILSLPPELLWSRTRHRAGIDHVFFREYFAGRPIGHAIEILSAVRLFSVDAPSSVTPATSGFPCR